MGPKKECNCYFYQTFFYTQQNSLYILFLYVKNYVCTKGNKIFFIEPSVTSNQFKN